MRGYRGFRAALVAAALAAGPAAAQDSDWEFIASGYLWLPVSTVSLDTPRGGVSAELSVSDAIDALDFAAMGTFEARQGRLGLAADLVYFNLGQRSDTPFGGLFEEAHIDTKITAITALALWRVQDGADFTLDLGAGLRSFDSTLDLTLSGGRLPSESLRREADWIDPVVALRAHVDFDEKWFGTMYLDAGGTGDGSTLQAALGVGYNIGPQWAVQGGWRYMEFDREERGQDIKLDMSGVIVGVSYRF